MNVLIACEFSGIVRDAFVALGHEAESCDLLPTERPRWSINDTGFRVCNTERGYHWQRDVLELIKGSGRAYDLMIAHPPCTHLSVSGARWFSKKKEEQKAAIDFFMALAQAPIERIAIENPISIMSSHWRKPDQIIQPWQFGHGETKATCLWLKNLPKLVPTKIVAERYARVHKEPPSPDRWKNRSRTLEGIAQAMAMQWGSLS